MRAPIVVLGVVVLSSIVAAQQPAGAPAAAPAAALKTFAASADVAALVAKAKAERRPDQGLVAQPLLQLAPYTVNIEYRAAVANAAVHEHEAELFYVIDGQGRWSPAARSSRRTGRTRKTSPDPRSRAALHATSPGATSSWCRRTPRTGSARSTVP